MKFKKSQDDMLILSYLQKLRLDPCRSIFQFWDDLYRKHDKSMIDNLKMIVEKRADDDPYGSELYTVKNLDLQLSLNFSRFSTELYRRYFEWIIKQKHLKPKSILDIGCDNGIITCFYGMIFPDAEVIGIDINAAAIECSNKLKNYLGLNNVHFKNIDIKDLNKNFSKGYFDIITSVRTLHEIIDFPEERYWSTLDMNLTENKSEANPLLEALRAALSPENGELICWERIPNTCSLAWWVSILHDSGLYVDLQKSNIIKFSEVGDSQAMPLLILDTQNRILPTATEILTFASQNDTIDFETRKSYEKDTAELAFYNYKNKTLLFGFQANYSNNSGNVRFEVWETEKYLLEYAYSTVNFRKLDIHGKDQALAIKNRLSAVIKDVAAYRNKTFYYESIEERDDNELNKHYS